MDIWKSWDGNWKIGSSSGRMEDQLVGCLVNILSFLLFMAIVGTFLLLAQLVKLIARNPKVGIPVVLGIVALFVFVPALGSLIPTSGPASASPARPAATASPVAQTQRPTVQPTVKPTPLRTALERTFWVKNHKSTGMWSASGDPGDDGKPAIRFGDTSSQFCSFLVMLPQERGRLYVFNPYSNDYFWIDADAVGPTGQPPERRPGTRPNGQNCAEAVYDGATLPRGAPAPR